MQCRKTVAGLVVAFVLAGTVLAIAETRQEFRFKVRRRASISLINQFGPISVRPSTGKVVLVTAILSDKVEVDHSQRGRRISVVSHLLPGADAASGRVEYQVFVPADSNVTLHTGTGPLHAERLHGDVILEGSTANVDCRDLSGGHVHVKTLSGLVSLTNVSDGHVEVTSVGGDVALNAVNGPLVRVNSTSGNIAYDGDFGEEGEYALMSNTGDILATAPAYASMDVVASSEHGKVENDFQLQPSQRSLVSRVGSTFSGVVGQAASSVKLYTFSGKIHLKKRNN
jgi:DUF4097 and DUF4098 domain-containing protein YvlB